MYLTMIDLNFDSDSIIFREYSEVDTDLQDIQSLKCRGCQHDTSGWIMVF